MAELDVPASLAITAQEVHVERVALDDRLQVTRATGRTMRQRVAERMLRPLLGVVRRRHFAFLLLVDIHGTITSGRAICCDRKWLVLSPSLFRAKTWCEESRWTPTRAD
jgi:hypothetical protein